MSLEKHVWATKTLGRTNTVMWNLHSYNRKREVSLEHRVPPAPARGRQTEVHRPLPGPLPAANLDQEKLHANT